MPRHDAQTDFHRRETPSRRGEPLIPEIVDPESERILKSLRSLTKLLDDSFTLPGTGIRFGWDSIVGLVPGVGDVATALLSAWIVAQARRLGVSRWTLTRMSWNIVVDAGLGAVPLVGDVFDVAWKANRKNMELLERHIAAVNRRAAQPRGESGKFGWRGWGRSSPNAS